MIICQNYQEHLLSDKKNKTIANKNTKPHQLEKKYLWPHGITPPLKNVRKHRFRKILPNKNTDDSEIDKEVCFIFD